MAKEKTLEELQVELDEMRAKYAAEAAKSAELEEENKALTANGKTKVVSGKYKHKSGTFKFADGAVMTRGFDGTPYPSEELLKIANKSDYTPGDDIIIQYPALKGLTHETATALIDKLIDKKYALLIKA